MTDFQKLIEILKDRGYTNQRIADAVGCTPAYISNLRSGRNKMPAWDKGQKLIRLEQVSRRPFAGSPL